MNCGLSVLPTYLCCLQVMQDFWWCFCRLCLWLAFCVDGEDWWWLEINSALGPSRSQQIDWLHVCALSAQQGNSVICNLMPLKSNNQCSVNWVCQVPIYVW